MSGMKNGYFDDLTTIVTNQDKFLLVYSSSHISDISSSLKTHSLEEKQLINSDFEYLAELTKSMCLVISSEQINIHNYSPKELFEQRIDTKDFF